MDFGGYQKGSTPEIGGFGDEEEEPDGVKHSRNLKNGKYICFLIFTVMKGTYGLVFRIFCIFIDNRISILYVYLCVYILGN